MDLPARILRREGVRSTNPEILWGIQRAFSLLAVFMCFEVMAMGQTYRATFNGYNGTNGYIETRDDTCQGHSVVSDSHTSNGNSLLINYLALVSEGFIKENGTWKPVSQSFDFSGPGYPVFTIGVVLDSAGMVTGDEHWKQNPRTQYNDFNAHETLNLNTGDYHLRWTGLNDFDYSTSGRACHYHSVQNTYADGTVPVTLTRIPGSCPVDSLRPIDDLAVDPLYADPVYDPGGTRTLTLENDGGIDEQDLQPGVYAALQAFRSRINAQAGGRFNLQSAFRTKAYQQHLREVYDKKNQLDAIIDDHPECTSVYDDTKSEFAKHQLGNQRPGNPLNPKYKRHTTGVAIDVGLNQSGLPLSTLISIGCSVGLYRPLLPGDQPHFELLPNFVLRCQ